MNEPKTAVTSKEYGKNKKFRKFVQRHTILMTIASPLNFAGVQFIVESETFVLFVISVLYILHISLYTLVFIDAMNESIERGLRFWGYAGYRIIGIVFYIPLIMLILSTVHTMFMESVVAVLMFTYLFLVYLGYPLGLFFLFIMGILAAGALLSTEFEDTSTEKWLYICFFVPIVGSVAYRFRKKRHKL